MRCWSGCWRVPTRCCVRPRCAERDGVGVTGLVFGVAARIEEKKPSGYDVAVDLLVDLREVCDPVVFASRLEALRREHGRKVTFVERLERAGL